MEVYQDDFATVTFNPPGVRMNKPSFRRRYPVVLSPRTQTKEYTIQQLPASESLKKTIRENLCAALSNLD